MILWEIVKSKKIYVLMVVCIKRYRDFPSLYKVIKLYCMCSEMYKTFICRLFPGYKGLHRCVSLYLEGRFVYCI